MEADWSAEIAPGLPEIIVPWSGEKPSENPAASSGEEILAWRDLRFAGPQLEAAIQSIPCAAQEPALAAALRTLHQHGSPWFTSKCDLWTTTPEAPDAPDPWEFDAADLAPAPLYLCASYLDILACDQAAFASFAAHEALLNGVVAKLRTQPQPHARVDFVLRAALRTALRALPSPLMPPDAASRRPMRAMRGNRRWLAPSRRCPVNDLISYTGGVKTLRISSLLVALAALFAFAAPAFAQPVWANTIPKPIPLYNGPAPGALGHSVADTPLLYVMLPKKPVTSAAILVIPGGGYQYVALGHEGLQIANWLNAQGMPAIVLDYRVAPYHYPVEIEDGMHAMRVIRANAKKWGIDPNRIGVWGFSAGGHLASTLGTHCNKTNPNATDPIDRLSCKPDFMVLSYPVISMRKSITHMGSRNNLLGKHPNPKLVAEFSNELRVTPSTPPTFIFVTERDPVVPVQNSYDFFQAMIRNHVPGELHVYDYGVHGCGLCGAIPALRSYPGLLRQWLIDHSWLPSDAPPPPTPTKNWKDWPAGFKGPGMLTGRK